MLLVGVLVGCTADSPEVEIYDAPLVVEGWIESGKPPVVFVTKGVPAIQRERVAEDLGQYLVRRAHVTVEHNGKVYDLPNMREDKYYMQYFYSAGWLTGEPGETYTLRVELDGQVATATTTIPEPQALDSITVEKTEFSDDIYYIWAHFPTDVSKKQYYHFFTWVTNSEAYYAPASLGLTDNENSNGYITLCIDRGPHLPNMEMRYLFREGDLVKLKFATMTEESYRFWENYEQNNLNLLLGLSAYYGNMVGNVEGALGYWAGYGIEEYEVNVTSTVME